MQLAIDGAATRWRHTQAVIDNSAFFAIFLTWLGKGIPGRYQCVSVLFFFREHAIVNTKVALRIPGR